MVITQFTGIKPSKRKLIHRYNLNEIDNFKSFCAKTKIAGNSN